MKRHDTRHRVRRIAVALVAAGLAAVPPAAWAHAEFVGGDSAPADSDQTLTLNVPEERGPAIHNAKVIVEVPGGFSVLGCEPKPEWSCAPSESGGRHVITWNRTGGADPDGHFTFRVHTADRPGSYPFEVNQFYADGDSSRWDGPPDSDSPAPVLRVG